MSGNKNQQPGAKNIGFPSLFGNNSPFSASAAPPHITLTSPPGFQLNAAHAQFLAQLQQAQSLQGGSHATATVASPTTVSGSSKQQRFHHKPPAMPMSAPQTVSSSSSAAAAAAAARKKKQKKIVPEKEFHERVENFLPESVFNGQLLEIQALVDDAVARKKAAVQEALMRPPPSFQTILRIYIFNTFANQMDYYCGTSLEKPNLNAPAEPPSWTLKIVGRTFLEESQASSSSSSSSGMDPPKFSSFIKRLSVCLDKKLYPDDHLIIWDRARSPALPDGFEIKRKGDQEFSVSIKLEVNNLGEKYKVSAALKEVIGGGVEVENRPRIVHAIWQYINARKLRIPEDPDWFFCDPPLHKVFGEGIVKLTEVPLKITPHLSPPQPIHLQHRIKLSGNNPAGTACYDVLVDVPFPIHKELNDLLGSTDKSKELGACEDSISEAIKKLQQHQRRRALLLGFSQSPVEFANNALLHSHSSSSSSSNKGIKFDAGETSNNERHSDVYAQPWVEDAVIRYLNRKPASDAPRNM